MTTAELLKLHKETCDKCYGIVQKKNNDYSGGATSPDALANFKMSTAIGLSPVMGLLLRIQDKMMRIKTFATDGALNVADETVNDAFEDIINYAILGKALMIEKAGTTAKPAAAPVKKAIPPVKKAIPPVEEVIKAALTDLIEEELSQPKPRVVPKNIIRKAIDLFEVDYIYYGEIGVFLQAMNKFATHLDEDEVEQSIQICEISESGNKEDEYVLVAVKKNSRLYIALGGGGKQPLA
jgi:hypothetical protein